VLRQVFGLRRNKNTGEYMQRKNEKVTIMLGDSDIISTMKSKRIGWGGVRQSVKLQGAYRRAKDRLVVHDSDGWMDI